MGVRLDALPDYLSKWKVPFTLYDGWRTRSRSSGDFVDVMAVGVHHTASATTPVKDLGWMYANSPDRPIGNGLLDRSGHFTLGAVRATNTQGRGGPYLTTRGTIPKDAGNTRMFAIEAANNGIGEQWQPAMIDTYIKLCAALIDCISVTTPGPALQVGDIVAHFEWAPGRKFDPAGNSPYAPGAALWNMNDFRRDVYTTLHPTTPNPPDEENDDMPKQHVIRASDGTPDQKAAWFILGPDSIAWCRTVKQLTKGRELGWYANATDDADAAYTAQEIQEMLDAFLVEGGAVPPGYTG